MNETRQIHILMAVAFLLAAILIGYNAFFTPSMVGVQSVRYLETPEVSPPPDSAPDPEPDSGEPTDDGGADKPEVTFPVNINTAEQWELEALPGIGPALAARIVEYRLAHGLFEYYEQLMEVSGIGESKYHELYDFITIEG